MKQKHAADPLSAADRELLNLIQIDFPRTSRPFAELGRQLGLNEAEVLSRLKELKADGIIRRIGGIFASEKLGFVSTLVALQVEESVLEEVAAAVSSYDGVTHNYERRHKFNLWFTLVAASDEDLRRILNEVSRLPGVAALRNLPAVRLFKIGVNFDLSGGET
ncbi:MAG TPA: Lrp/AsnC family transcriptional regulator [Firmicutes bacterium]|nr:Lrp/AsnC family transcriptional regulator [Bacillota bacterium]